MSNSIIYKTRLDQLKPASWRGQVVYKQHAKLRNHIGQRFGPEMAGMFAEPHITEQDWAGYSDASWSSDIFEGRPIPLNQLPPERQQAIRQQLGRKLGILQDYSQQLLESENPEDMAWGQLINKALQLPGDEHILVEGDKVALVCWGMERQKQDSLGSFDLRKQFPRVPGAASEPQPTEPAAAEPAAAQLPAPEPAAPTPPEPATPPVPPTQPLESTPPDPSEPSKPSDPPQPPPPSAVTPQSVPPATPPPVPPAPPVTSTSQTPPPGPPPTPPIPQRPWWRRWWWLLLLILLLLVLFLFFRTCHPFSTALLPAQPGRLIPIDTTKIISDPDSVKFIVSDRINVALTGANRDIPAFAQKFKELYPGNNYQIIYFDTLTARLQIQLPANERERIKAELPGRMPGFELLIWDEDIFDHSNIPTDPGFRVPEEFWYHQKIKAISAWDLTRGNPDLVVAILDDGFDLDHEEFKGKIFKPWNVADHSAQVNTGQKAFHGTHVAGLALALADNGAGVAGIAPACKFMPVQVGDQDDLMSTTAIIDGVLYAMGHGAQVINMSLGKKIPARVKQLPAGQQRQLINSLFKDEEKFWTELFQKAYKQNIVTVLAAGNQDLMIGIDPMERNPYTIKVSAVNPNDQKADFSNYGDLSTISAPGVSIYSSLPGNKFGFLDGTSMAAPIVTGGIALIKSVNPGITFDQVVNLLQSTGLPVNSPGKPIGKIIQLDRALGMAGKPGNNPPTAGCGDVQRRIDSLNQEIARLQGSCPLDTLHIPPHAKNLDFAIGRWKSTSYIYNIKNGDPVTLYFDFYKNSTGRLTLVQPDNSTCTADLALSLRSQQIYIDQQGPSVCTAAPYKYPPYTFTCHADSTGRAQCEARNKEDPNNHFLFNLIEVNSNQ